MIEEGKKAKWSPTLSRKYAADVLIFFDFSLSVTVDPIIDLLFRVHSSHVNLQSVSYNGMSKIRMPFFPTYFSSA